MVITIIIPTGLINTTENIMAKTMPGRKAANAGTNAIKRNKV
jgi:hypothetical protein